jgi:hypothetical protein
MSVTNRLPLVEESKATLSKRLLYTYQPLEGPTWIRILKIYPSEQYSDRLHCEIHHVDRGNIPPYDAVSYTWGHPGFTRQLHCGQTSFLLITPVVETMLRRLRSRYQPKRFWIDAISLDQNNDREKEQQIPFMGEIYREAIKVRVWLGDYDEIKPVFAFFRRLGSLMHLPTNNEIPQTLRMVFDQTNTLAVQNFLHLSWFHR